MRSPPQAADHVTETPHGLEGGIERRPADGVVHQIETSSGSVITGVLLDAAREVIDRGRAESLDLRVSPHAAGGKDISAEGTCDLDGHLADAPGPLHQHFLSSLHRRPI